MSTPRMFVDLHTHSRASDGTDRPSELVRKADDAGLAAVALTDHDSLDGLEEAQKEAGRLGMRFVPGLEIAVKDQPGELHLVGLWMRKPSEPMRQALLTLQQNRRARNQEMLAELARLGLPMSMEEVRAHSGGVAVGRPHIALAMKCKGYVQSRREAFERYLGTHGQAFVPRALMSPEEGISLLRNEGATVVLAHPCLYRSMTRQRLDGLLNELKSYGLNAIEAYHSSHAPDQTRMCVDLAAKHGLLLSGGTDYHGLNKEGIAIGRGLGGNVRVPLYVLEKLEEFRREQGLWVYPAVRRDAG